MYFTAEIFRTQIISNMRTKLDSIIYLLPLSIIMSCFCLNINSQVVLQRCDVVNLWQGSNSLNVNSVDKQEGTASLEFTGSGTDWFAKKFSQTNTGINESAYFNFWVYVSDISKFNGDGQVELTSSGGPDTDEYSWSVSALGLQNGWNYVQLQISSANKSGSPDLKAINYFRFYQVLSGDITGRLDDLRFTTGMTPPLPTDPLDIKGIDYSTLDGKVMFGYQGWFSHPDDGSELARWRHWGTLQDANTLGIEMYPDIREHEADENYMTGLTFPDGRPVRIYSPYNKKTVLRHMKWLRDYSLDGVFLQRFNVSTRDRKLRAFRDTVTANVMYGCERYDRAFVNMYDLSGLHAGEMDDLIDDWKHLVDDLKILESPNYLWHRGKPLVSLWGFTVRNELPVADLEQVIEFFTNGPEKYRASIMLGTNHDFHSRSDWQTSLSKVDVISPWTVGRYGDANSNEDFVNKHIKPGQDWCDKKNIDFLPVVWPGFSWYNLKREGTYQKNQHPRDGGNFIWTQATRVISANAKMVYIAMFDEVDEGTAMYKLTETKEESPAQGYWLALDEDGYDLPSDWYLRCASLMTEVVKGKAQNRTSLDTPPDGIDNFKVDVLSTKCGTTDGKLTFSYPETDPSSLLEFSIDGGATYSYQSTAGSTSLESGALTSGIYDVWVRRTDGSFPTDLGPYQIFDFSPDAIIETIKTTCGLEDGTLDIQVGDNPYLGPVQFSIDGGSTYDLTTVDGTWTYSIPDMARGDHDVWARWADETCPVKVGTFTIEAEPIPVTFYSSVDGGEFVKSESNKVYACPNYSLDIYAEPAEDSWTWSWTGDLNFQATGRSIQISDKLTTEMYGLYYVSYEDAVNDCGVTEELFFIWANPDCPVGIEETEHGKFQIKVYPNPTADIVNIRSQQFTIETIEVSDISGRIVFSEKDCNSSEELIINLSNCENGTYLYSLLSSEGELVTGTIIKK